jgi:hypothetical protein
MKNIVLVMTICLWVSFTIPASALQTHPAKQKKDTIRDLKNQPKPRVVKSRSERLHMQQQQIKLHEKQLKKVHQAQQKINKELHRKDSD